MIGVGVGVGVGVGIYVCVCIGVCVCCIENSRGFEWLGSWVRSPLLAPDFWVRSLLPALLHRKFQKLRVAGLVGSIPTTGA